MSENISELIAEARMASTYPDVRPISYRLVEKLCDELEKVTATPHPVGFADRERLAGSAYGVFHPGEPRVMAHDFRGGFHLGFLDGVASTRALSDPQRRNGG